MSTNTYYTYTIYPYILSNPSINETKPTTPTQKKANPQPIWKYPSSRKLSHKSPPGQYRTPAPPSRIKYNLRRCKIARPSSRAHLSTIHHGPMHSHQQAPLPARARRPKLQIFPIKGRIGERGACARACSPVINHNENSARQHQRQPHSAKVRAAAGVTRGAHDCNFQWQGRSRGLGRSRSIIQSTRSHRWLIRCCAALPIILIIIFIHLSTRGRARSISSRGLCFRINALFPYHAGGRLVLIITETDSRGTSFVPRKRWVADEGAEFGIDRVARGESEPSFIYSAAAE